MISLFKKIRNTETVYTVNSLPYIYQSEYYSLAWGLVHKGFYVDPKGMTYKYNMPKNWNFYTSEAHSNKYLNDELNNDLENDCAPWGHEMDGFIHPDNLFKNLRSSVKSVDLFGLLRKTNPINQDIIKSLKRQLL